MNLREFKKRMAQVTSREGQVALLDSFAEELADKEQYAEAARYYREALALESGTNAKAYFSGQIGICYYNLGNDREALRNLLRSVRTFDPEQPEFMPDMFGFVHFYIGSIYEYQGKVAKSLEARLICEQYGASQEKDTRWMLFAGMSRNYEALEQHEEAIRYSQKAIQVLSDNDPGLAYLYESMANNHMNLRQYQEAIQHFSKVLDLDPGFERREEIYLKIATCYHRLTNHQLALESYRKILELKQIRGQRTGLTWLFVKIAHSYFRLEKYESSLLMTLEGLRRNPRKKAEKAELRSYLTNNYYEMGHYQEAIHEGERTLKLARRFPNDNLFYFRLALSHHKVGDLKSFSRYRTICRKYFPEDSWNTFLEKLG